MFTKQQLNVLIEAQAGDDWTPNYFIDRAQTLAYDCDDLTDAENKDLFALLERYTYEQVRDLQVALTILGSLPTAQY